MRKVPVLCFAHCGLIDSVRFHSCRCEKIHFSKCMDFFFNWKFNLSRISLGNCRWESEVWGNPTWTCHCARGQRLIDIMSVHGRWWRRDCGERPPLPFFRGVNSGSSCQLVAVHSVSALQRARYEWLESLLQRARRSSGSSLCNLLRVFVPRIYNCGSAIIINSGRYADITKILAVGWKGKKQWLSSSARSGAHISPWSPC